MWLIPQKIMKNKLLLFSTALIKFMAYTCPSLTLNSILVINLVKLCTLKEKLSFSVYITVWERGRVEGVEGRRKSVTLLF